MVSSMPRVTFNEFCHRHEQLKKAWGDPQSPFLSLGSNEQWALHDYYCPGMGLTTDGLKIRWRSLHEKPTSLHQRAGRAYAKLKPHLEGSVYGIVESDKRAKSGKNVEVVVHGMVHPELNVELMAGAVTMLGEQLRQEANNQHLL